MKNKRILFYTSNIENVKAQKFYQIDFDILRSNGHELIITNKKSDLFKFWKYDALFQYFYTFAAFYSLIANCFGKEVFHTGGIDALNEETTSPKAFKRQKLFFWICYHLATKCIIVSDNDWNNIMKIYNGRLQKKLVKSYHVVDADKFLCPIEGREKLFISICWQGSDGNIKRKGIDKSLILYKYLLSKEEFKDYQYIIAGRKGPGTPFLMQQIEKLGLTDKVEVTGEISEEEKVSMMKKAKYYFQLSTYEGFGLAALEAMAAGNIVIHTGAGGLKYVVDNYGILVNGTSIEQDCEAIYMQMITYDESLLKKAQVRTKEVFAYDKRKNEFKEIFGN